MTTHISIDPIEVARICQKIDELVVPLQASSEFVKLIAIGVCYKLHMITMVDSDAKNVDKLADEIVDQMLDQGIFHPGTRN